MERSIAASSGPPHRDGLTRSRPAGRPDAAAAVRVFLRVPGRPAPVTRAPGRCVRDERRSTCVDRDDVCLTRACPSPPRPDRTLGASASRLASRPAPGTPAPPRRRRPERPLQRGRREHRYAGDLGQARPPESLLRPVRQDFPGFRRRPTPALLTASHCRSARAGTRLGRSARRRAHLACLDGNGLAAQDARVQAGRVFLERSVRQADSSSLRAANVARGRATCAAGGAHRHAARRCGVDWRETQRPGASMTGAGRPGSRKEHPARLWASSPTRSTGGSNG